MSLDEIVSRHPRRPATADNISPSESFCLDRVSICAQMREMHHYRDYRGPHGLAGLGLVVSGHATPAGASTMAVQPLADAATTAPGLAACCSVVLVPWTGLSMPLRRRLCTLSIIISSLVSTLPFCLFPPPKIHQPSAVPAPRKSATNSTNSTN